MLGWTPAVNGTTAVVGADRSAAGAVYKGLAVANDRLFASDFHNGRVDVFDASFKLITTPGGFKDAKVPKGFAPFGIQALGGDIFVTFAKQDAAAKDDVPVPGQAYVDEFTHRRPARRARREQRQEERAAERTVGARARAGRLLGVQQRPARRELRQRADQRVHEARLRPGCSRVSSATQTARRS